MTWYAITFIVVISVVMYILFGAATAYLLFHYGKYYDREESVMCGCLWPFVWIGYLMQLLVEGCIIKWIEKIARWWEKKESESN